MATVEQREKWNIYRERDWQVTIEMTGTIQGVVALTYIVESCPFDRAVEVAIEQMVDDYCQPDEDGDILASVSSVTVVPSPMLIRRHDRF